MRVKVKPLEGVGVAPPVEFFSQFNPATVCLEGCSFPVTQEGSWAYLDVVKEQADKVLFFGWAAHMKTLKSADAILVFVDNKMVYRGATGYARPKVVEHFDVPELGDSGFLFEVDRELFDDDPEVRCFALFKDHISEVKYPNSFPWLPKSKLTSVEDCLSATDETCALVKKGAHSYLITRACSPVYSWKIALAVIL